MRYFMPAMRRSRHPLVRALSLLLGLALIGVLMVFGLAVVCVLLVGGTVFMLGRQWTRGGRIRQSAPGNGHRPDVLEGEFVVIRQDRHVAR